MSKERIKHRREELIDYVYWLASFVMPKREIDSHHDLIFHLFRREFSYTMTLDGNRASDGIDLRERYSEEHGYYPTPFNGECRMLEMMVALALRMEKDIMSDSEHDNRAGEWFHVMLDSMNIGHIDDSNYDQDIIDEAIDTVLERSYSRDGDGGLFYIPRYRRDLRRIEIWYQMLYWLDEMRADEFAL